MILLLIKDQGCRYLEFQPDPFGGKRLINHGIRVTDVMDEEFCGSLCFMEPNCVSYNFKLLASQTGVHKCELNNSTHEGHEVDLKDNPNYLYRGAKVRTVTLDPPFSPPPTPPQKKK